MTSHRLRRSAAAVAVLGFAALCAALAGRSASQTRPAPRAPVDVPVIVDHGNAIVPVVGSYDGYAALPPDLVVVSLPFGKGAVPASAPLAAYDARNRPLPTQSAILARWNDGTIRWAQLLFDSHLDVPKWPDRLYGNPELVSATTPEGKTEQREVNANLPWDFRVRAGAPAPPPRVAVRVEQTGDRITVANGRITVRIEPKTTGFGFSQVAVEGVDGAAAGPLRLEIRRSGAPPLSTAGLAADEVKVEESGPLRAVVYLRGRLSGVYEWQTRLFVHADEPAVRAEHTLGGLGDREIDSVESIRLEFTSALGDEFEFRAAGTSVEFPGRVTRGQRVALEQTAPNLFPPRDFAYQLAVEGAGASGVIARGGRSDGWLRATSPSLALGLALRDFSPKGPKALRVGPGGACAIDLWPPGQVLALSRARAITHEVLYGFQPAPKKPVFEKLAQEYHHAVSQDLPYRAYVRPIVPLVDVEYACATGAYGPFVTAGASKLSEYETAIEQNFENWHARHFDRGVHYGMLHYGDYVAPWPGDDGGNPDRPHWRDHEWEFTSALFLYYLRHGDRRAFSAGTAAYRHFMDVDVHYTRRRGFYHSYGDRGEMHETYYGPDYGHTVCAGLVDAYLFTGDRRAIEAARAIGDNLAAAFEEGDETIRKMFQKEVRGGAWPMLALLRLHEITLDARYLKAARRGLELMQKEPELWLKGGTWQSVLVSAVLESFHRLTRDSTARKLFLQNVTWGLQSYYIPELRTLGPRPGGPAFGYGATNVNSGASLMLQAAPLGYAYELTGDRYYLDVAYRLLGAGLKGPREIEPRDRLPLDRRSNQTGATRSDGKWFSLMNFYTNRLPAAFGSVSGAEMDQIKRAQPKRR